MSNPIPPHQPPGISRDEVEMRMREVQRSVGKGPRPPRRPGLLKRVWR